MKKFLSIALLATLALSAGACKNKTHCRQAYREMNEFIASMERALGPGRSSGNRPSEDAFVNQCLQLPEPAQRCSIMSYSMQHQAECQQYRNQTRSLGR